MRTWRGLAGAMVLLFLAGCAAPEVQARGPAVTAPRLDGDAVIARDGAKLPLRLWRAAGVPHAVILALHGFNDYSHSFAMPGHYWAARGVTTYAYDQRGFGEAPHPGVWPGVANLESDLCDAIAAVHARNPGVPLYLVGESMGSAVILATFSHKQACGPGAPAVAGAVLGAPAVWGRQELNPFYRVVLYVSSHLFPAMTMAGQGLGVQASDNIPMLRAQGRDPLVIKETRVDAVAGIVNLMSVALSSAGRFTLPALVMRGAHDEIIPEAAVRRMLAEMHEPHWLVYYPKGWHMLYRDRQAVTVWRDVLAWIADRKAPLPSGDERKSLPGPEEVAALRSASGAAAER